MKKRIQKIIFFCIALVCFTSCQTVPEEPKEKTEAYKLSAFSMPLQEEYVYDYLGMRFQLGQEVNEAIEEGKLMMFLDAGYDQNTQELLYARQAILFIPKQEREKTWNTAEEVKAWKENAQRFGYIGAYKRSVLETTDIAALTNCSRNKNIGETPDGTWQYYISSNDIAEVQQAVERFRKTLVTIYAMTPFKEGVNIFGEARPIQQTIGDFKTIDIDGNTITKEVFSEHDLTLVNIFSTECEPCLQQMLELEKLKNETKTNSIQVIGIVYNAFEDGIVQQEIVEKTKQLSEQLGITYSILLPDTVLMEGRLKGVSAFPETFFVDNTGNIIGEYYLGARPKEDWLKVIEKNWNNLKEENKNE